ncbi:PTS system mannose/fructose/sorbose family IID component [Lentibacillus halodurans]|uniref:PTS system mannose/fructose/sorbose family IID component n=1 Tax=Lentibacillus halodurans TaxID=237679 RepID=A0A1I0YKA2_9BACI|nr:PTS system mannose/fructose/sorbose family IID component [Lentibacillus halodurans]
MGSNMYENQTPAAELNSKQLRHLVWRSLLLQASFNYERMQAAGWLYSAGIASCSSE